MNQHLIVIDDFYDAPDQVRSHALSLPYYTKPGATYPGQEAKPADFDWVTPRKRLQDQVLENINGDCPKSTPFVQGKFRVAVAKDQQSRLDGVHEDIQPWSGIVYLTPEEHCFGSKAIAFYVNKETGKRIADQEWLNFIVEKLSLDGLSVEEKRSRYWEYMRDMDNWLQVSSVENRYNRAILLYAKHFHASEGLFGDSPQTGRLTQHFEYYYGG